MYFMALFLIGYCSTLFASFAFIAADYSVTISHETAPYIAGALTALSVAFCVAILVWMGEFLARPASYAMLIMPAVYLAIDNLRNLRPKWKYARATRMVMCTYEIPYDKRLERGHAVGHAVGFILGAAFFMPSAGAI